MQANSANVFVYDSVQLSLYVLWLYEPCLLVVQGVLADLLHLSALPVLACHPIHVVQEGPEDLVSQGHPTTD